MIKKKYIAIALLFSLIIFTNSAFAGYDTLRLGDKGEDVRKMQEKLRSVGYNIKVDGVFGQGTLREIKRFQKASGLKMDGTAGNATLEKLYGEKAPAKTSKNSSTGKRSNDLPQSIELPEASLKIGDKGEDVRYMQLALRQLNYNFKDKLGNFGNSTKYALSKFQGKYKLNRDGVAGDRTLRLLYSKCSISVSGRVKSQSELGNTNTKSSNPQNLMGITSAVIPNFSLREGMQSDYVQSMQLALAQMGLYTGRCDGKYGNNTALAVKNFQKKHRLSRDGIAGQATLKQIYRRAGVKYTFEKAGSSPEVQVPNNKRYINSATIPINSIRKGDKSNFVKEMQLALKQLGYSISNADGNFGSGTLSALKTFQRRSGLRADGVAGSATLKKLYESANVSVSYEQSNNQPNNPPAKIHDGDNNVVNPIKPSKTYNAPSIGSVKLLDWYSQVKPQMRVGRKVQMYDPVTNSGYELTVLSAGRHLDAEPSTAQDTENLNRIFGGISTWNPKILYAQLPNGEWSIVSTHNMPHLSGNIKDNNFNGHLCVHFFRDMEETRQKDPHYGVQNQKNLRQAWKRLTGEDIN